MTTPLNIDSLKSFLDEKEKTYNTIINTLESKVAKNQLLPSSIAGKNSVCVDLLKIISEETIEFEKLCSAINKKKAEREFLAEQLAEQENNCQPDSILKLINKLDKEILAGNIYSDALTQSIQVQTFSHDALIESVNLESVEYTNLDKDIISLKQEAERLASELESATAEYENLSKELNLNNSEAETPDQTAINDNTEGDPKASGDDSDLNDSKVNQETNQHDNQFENVDAELNTFSIDPVEQIIDQDITEIKSDYYELQQISESFKNETDDKQSNFHDENNYSHLTETEETELGEFSIEPVELTDDLNTTFTPSESTNIEEEVKQDPQNFEDESDLTKFNNIDSNNNVTVTVDEDLFNFTIDPIEPVSDQDDNSLSSSTYEAQENEFDTSKFNDVDDPSELKAALATAELDALENNFISGTRTVESIPENKRTTTRYVRTDIKTKILKNRLIGDSKPYDVELLDISSKGALIKTTTKLRKNIRVTLKFNFQLDARRFSIAGRVVRKADNFTYGIKFNSYQDEFADHLLSTQTDLVFK